MFLETKLLKITNTFLTIVGRGWENGNIYVNPVLDKI